MFSTLTPTKLRSIVLTVSFLTGTLFTVNAQQPQPYPRITGYFAVLQPIGSWNRHGFTDSFSDVHFIGFPFGMNILKSDNFGISFEVVPSIRTEHGISKVNSVLFHPGAMFRFKHGFTFIGRAAFETSGRFGLTPVVNQVLVKGKHANMYVAMPFPIRFGNDLPASIGTGVQVGIGF